MMKKTTLYLAAAVALLAICSSCCPCRFSRRSAATLNGTTWRLAQLVGKDVYFDAGTFEMQFHEDGTLTGCGSCNNFSASYTATSRGGMDIGIINSTRMYCPLSETEQSLFTELDNATHYEINGQIMLLLQDGEIRVILAAVNKGQ